MVFEYKNQYGVDFDINKAEKISGGFASLDKWIGGFVLGTVNIITGYNSSGKSTLINQMCIAEPLEQGYNTFIFSGELSRSQLRAWIQFPLAGPEYTLEADNVPNLPKGYYIPREKNFARKFNSVIHLIAHPRKTDVIRRLTKLDVAGSGDITNLADYVISIHRVSEEEKQDNLTNRGDVIVPACPYDNMIDLFKNRPLGHQDKTTIGLYFHYPSKRLYGASDNLNKKFSWIKIWKPILECAVEVDEKCPWD